MAVDSSADEPHTVNTDSRPRNTILHSLSPFAVLATITFSTQGMYKLWLEPVLDRNYGRKFSKMFWGGMGGLPSCSCLW